MTPSGGRLMTSSPSAAAAVGNLTALIVVPNLCRALPTCVCPLLRGLLRRARVGIRAAPLRGDEFTTAYVANESFAHCRIFESGRSTAILLTSLVELLQRPLAPNSVRLDEFSEWRLTKYCGQSDRKSPTASLGRVRTSSNPDVECPRNDGCWSSQDLVDSDGEHVLPERRPPCPSKRSAGRVRETYRFIEAHQKQYSVEVMCRVLGVARSGYYEWLREPVSKRGQEDARLLRLIRASFNASHGIYGAPRVFLDLREAGETCSKHRVARLMRESGLRALHGYRTRRVSIGKPSVLIPNLLQRQFTVTRPNKAWVTDITYVRTWQGWLYSES